MQDTCANCGYDVTSLVGNGLEKCPECGTRVRRVDLTRAWGRRRWVRQAALLTFGLAVPLAVLPVCFLLIPDPPPDVALVEGAVCLAASWAALLLFSLGRRARVSGVARSHAKGSRVVGAIAAATMNTFLAWASVFVVCMIAWG